MEDKLDQMFNVESLGLKEETSDYDTLKIEEFDSNIRLENGYYGVDLPWHDKVSLVKSNYGISKAVLDRVVTQLHKDKLYDAYNEIFQQQLEDGIIEEIPLNEVNVYDYTWIPHRAVVKSDEQTTTKLRVVLNCSLKVGDAPSLNEAAYAGINLMNDLLEILLRIRSDDYLVISDVKSAFLMIRLNKEEDKKRFSILWKNKEGNLVGYKYNRIVFGYSASPFVLNHVIKHHIRKYPADKCSEIINHNIYVDNLLFTADDPAELLQMYYECRGRMAEGGFDLRSWATNNSDLKDKFNADNTSTTHGSDLEKLLGYEYSKSNDSLKLQNNFDYVEHFQVSKRIMLANVAKIFDPLGLTLPLTVKAKILLKDAWSLKVGWDEVLPNDLTSKFNKLSKDLVKIHELEFPRKAYKENSQLVCFSDASKDVYGMAAYARYKEDDSFQSNLIFAKCKNAPAKSKTLPTLELLGVFLVFKCLELILTGLKYVVSEVVVCTDAQVVLSWLLSGNIKCKNIFACNRLKDIRAYKERLEAKYNLKFSYKFVPTEYNCADLLTRGLTLKEYLIKRKFWLEGPEFLSKEKICWPVKPFGCLSSESKLLCNPIVECKGLDLTKFSSFHTVVRVFALVIKFLKKLRKVKFVSYVNCYDEARKLCIKSEQKLHFSDEIKYLTSKEGDKSIPPSVKNLNMYLDSDGVLRSRGRLERCIYFDHDTKNPIVMSKNGHLTELIIWYYHEKCKHLGAGTTLSLIRNAGFWIPHGRNKVKKVIGKCMVCRKINSFPFRYPKPTDLPKDRVNYVKPFEHTGFDFTGHVYIKIGNEVVKMYILLFTCLNVRCVHLELLPSMSTEHFLQAFIRFSNLFSIPRHIYSDNATTFKFAASILEKSSVDDAFLQFLLKNNITHKKIPLYSAWVGATWERLIRIVKTCIHKVVGRKRYDYFQFVTLLTDIEMSINSRPLTYRDESLDALTPNHFLKFDSGRALQLDALAGSQLAIPRRSELVSSIERREDFAEKFRVLFYEEYLLALKSLGQDLYLRGWENKVKQGDIVLISSPSKSRPYWDMGRVTEIIPSSDGRTRFVKVIKADRDVGTHPIKHLYPLEISIEEEVEMNRLETPSESKDENVPSRPSRVAKERCKELLKRN